MQRRLPLFRLSGSTTEADPELTQQKNGTPVVKDQQFHGVGCFLEDRRIRVALSHPLTGLNPPNSLQLLGSWELLRPHQVWPAQNKRHLRDLPKGVAPSRAVQQVKLRRA